MALLALRCRAAILGSAGLAGLHAPPTPELGRLVFLLLFLWVALLGQGQGHLRWLVRPPASLRAERMGVGAASFQDEGGLLERVSSAVLPDARGTVQRAGFRVQ